jgi:hypothetical protein
MIVGIVAIGCHTRRCIRGDEMKAPILTLRVGLVIAGQTLQAQSPLTGLPSQRGPHLNRMTALEDDSWLELGPPAPDPKWGRARGRAWNAAMPLAPELWRLPLRRRPARLTNADRLLAHRISQGDPRLLEAREWKLMFNDKATRSLIGQMYGAGAPKMYIDLFIPQTGREGAGQRTAKAYVELPADEAQRSACLEIAGTYRHDNGLRPESPVAPATSHFLVIELPPSCSPRSFPVHFPFIASAR